MTFAEQMRNNYQPGPVLSEEEKRENGTADYLIMSTVYAVKEQCRKISAQARSLEGYYCFNYDEHYIGKDYPYTVFYKNDYCRDRGPIDHFNPGQSCLPHAHRDRVIAGVRNELNRLGFRQVDVHAEDVMGSLHVGHTSFLLRPKYKAFPAFRICVKVSW